jgi:polar amino acid transport system permease protein
MTATTAAGRRGMTRRQRTRLIRGVQYAVFVGVTLLIVLKADWPRLSHDYFNLTIARQLFPDILSTALKNTAAYTAMGFAFGLGLGLVLALMRLSVVAPYRWVANVYIEFFRGIPLLLPRVWRADGHRRAAARTAVLTHRARPGNACCGIHGRDHPCRDPGRPQGAG